MYINNWAASCTGRSLRPDRDRYYARSPATGDLATLCAAVTGHDLDTATACDLVKTTANANVKACTYAAAGCCTTQAEQDAYKVNCMTPMNSF